MGTRGSKGSELFFLYLPLQVHKISSSLNSRNRPILSPPIFTSLQFVCVYMYVVVTVLLLQRFISVSTCRESMMGRRQTFSSWMRMLGLMFLLPPLQPPSSLPPHRLPSVLLRDWFRIGVLVASKLFIYPRLRLRYQLLLSFLLQRKYKQKVNLFPIMLIR